MKNKYKFLTIREVAERLQKMNEGEVLDFTLDDELIQEPSGWFGFRKTTIFCEPYGNICMGNYGASAARIYSIQYNTVEEIAEIIQEWLDDEACCIVSELCVEVSAQELWEEFGEIPMNPDTEKIEREWNGFPVGTHREEIWHWFEDTFDMSVAEDLMGL